MRKGSSAMTGSMWYIKFSYKYHIVENFCIFALAALNAHNSKTRLSEPKILYQEIDHKV